MKEIILGNKYQDCITGFKGRATGLCIYISGCNQALLAPDVSSDGTFRDAQWFDWQRLQLLDANRVVLSNTNPGFDKPGPKR